MTGGNQGEAHAELIDGLMKSAIGRADLFLWKNHAGFDRRTKTRFGLPGSSDLLGCLATRITPAMVGMTFGRFLGCEAKTGKADPSKKQSAFGAALERVGGVYLVARDPDAIKRFILYGEGDHGRNANHAAGQNVGGP